MARILIVEARFYGHLNDMLLAGARRALDAAGHGALLAIERTPIVDVRMDEIQKRLAANGRNVKIVLSTEVSDYLGAAGYSPAYGARPLARLIEKEVLNRLAVLILRGAIKDGELARVELDDGHIVVIPNHSDSEEDSEMYDESDAVAELEDADGDLDLYD